MAKTCVFALVLVKTKCIQYGSAKTYTETHVNRINGPLI